MGHQRLGWLPQAYRWQDVVAMIAGNGSAAAVAGATLLAANKGMAGAIRDPGVRHVVWLRAQAVMAARETNVAMELCGMGVAVAAFPRTFDPIGAVTDAVDDPLTAVGERRRAGADADVATVTRITASATPTTPRPRPTRTSRAL